MAAAVRVLPNDRFNIGLRLFARHLRDGKGSITDAVSACLQRIACLNPALGAYVQVLDDSALAEAMRLDSLLQAGVDLGPLMGVPVAVKENIIVQGADCRGGTPIDVSDIVPFEGDFVASLRRAGAVIVGITAMCELAMSGVGTNVFRGTTRNPWDSRVARACGGSSNGSAVAVAAGLCGFAVGTDTGGSVRSPAAFTGVVGYKPTQKVWSRHGVLPLASSFDTIGTLARTVEDTQLICSVLAPAIAASVESTDRWRVGFVPDEIDACAPAVRQTLGRAKELLQCHGIEFAPVSMPPALQVEQFYEHRLRREFFTVYGESRFDIEPGTANPDVTGRIARMRKTDDACHDDECLDSMHAAASLFERCDVLMLPTKYHLAPPLPALGDLQAHMQTSEVCRGPTRMASVLGLCAISVPVLETKAALPVGLQFACPPGSDARLLRFARDAEAVLGPIAPAPVHRFLPAAVAC